MDGIYIYSYTEFLKEIEAGVTPERLDELARTEHRYIGARVQQWVGCQKSTRPDTLRYLSRHSDVFTRECVAYHRATDEDTLRYLAQNETELGVLKMLLRNPNLPMSEVLALRSHHDYRVRNAAKESERDRDMGLLK